MKMKEMGKNKVIHLTILVFVMLSALMMTVGTIVILQTTGSIKRLFETAKPPHFLQMHTGEINQEEVENFADSIDYVTAEETVEMYNIDGVSIWYGRQAESGDKLVSMSGSRMDNGFVKQNKKFDFLLGEENQILHITQGNIGVPVSYRENYGLQTGDKLILSQGDFYQEYTITNFVRDAQMATTMASSTRFLLSDEDYKDLRGKLGEKEYILEFRLADSSDASRFQKSYEAEEAHMPKNGQAITYPMIQLVNALGGGMTAAMLVLMSVALMLIVGVVLKYIILASLEEEIYEIGVLKAIGISEKDIQKQYRKKYQILAAIGCFMGYVLGMAVSSVFTKEIQTMFGGSRLKGTDFVIAAGAACLVYILILHTANRILRKLRKITVVQALVRGETDSRPRKHRAVIFTLRRHGSIPVNGYLGLKELLAEGKMWGLLILIFLLAGNMILNPLNLVHTFESPGFASSMGTADSDVQVIVQAEQHLAEKCNQIVHEIQSDMQIEQFAVYGVQKCEIQSDKEVETVPVESGDYSKFGVQCLEGRAPEKEGEIAISYFCRKKLQKGLGDTLSVTRDGVKRSYQVCGIYQDMTSGGYTAKIFSSTTVENAQNYMVLFDCRDKDSIQRVADDYDQRYEFSKALPTEEYCRQTFGSVMQSFQKVEKIMIMVTVVMIMLVMVLFLKLQKAKKQKELDMLLVLGFESADLRKQYVFKSAVMAGIGTVAGIVTANTLGAKLTGGVLSAAGLGIARLQYISDPWINVVFCPFGLLGIAIATSSIFMRIHQKKPEIRSMQD